MSVNSVECYSAIIIDLGVILVIVVMVSVILLIVILLSVIILTVILLNVWALVGKAGLFIINVGFQSKWALSLR
jgi:hypothetical protein